MNLMRWCVPDSALQIKQLTSGLRQWIYHFHGGALDGEQRTDSLVARWVLPIMTAHGIETLTYECVGHDDVVVHMAPVFSV